MKRLPLPLLLVLGATLALTDCATIGPPQPPSLNLPKPPKDLRAARKGNRVTLTWTIPSITTDRETIRSFGPTRICRSPDESMKACGTPVGQAAPVAASARVSGRKALDSFTDTVPSGEKSDPFGFLTYAVEVLNVEGRSAGLSNQVRVPMAPTLPPPRDFQGRVTSQGVVLSWTKVIAPEFAQDKLHFIIRVHRKEQGSQQQTTVGEVPINSEPALTDADIGWEKTYEYSAETVTIIHEPNGSEGQIEGEDTAEVKVFAHDVFPPTVPSGLQAVFSGPGQPPFIDLVWAPVNDADLSGYNVYRHEQGTEPLKLNSDLLKAPAYRDRQVSAGHKYFYSVTAVDVRGNESARSEEASESVP